MIAHLADECDHLDEALTDADAIVLVTEWNQFRELTPEHAGALATGRTIIDARNVLDPEQWRAAGWEYVGLGRR